MKILSELSTTSRPWQLLAFIALGLEACALFFQYVMELQPCIMCVYQRLAIATIFAAGVVGSLGYHNIYARSISYILWGLGSIWGLIIAIEHVEIQESENSFFYSCEFIPNFPSWAPLHEWMPWLFEATGDCGKISWQFLGFSMPQWMIVVYAGLSLVFIAVLANRLIQAKQP